MKHSFAIAVAVVVTAVCISLSPAKDADAKKKPKKKPATVKSLMLAAHKTTKSRKAPLLIVQTELKRKTPNWTLLATNTKPLSKLAEAIKDVRFGYKGHPGPYVKHVKALALAAKTHDLPKARIALAGIQKSCAACHYGK